MQGALVRKWVESEGSAVRSGFAAPRRCDPWKRIGVEWLDASVTDHSNLQRTWKNVPVIGNFPECIPVIFMQAGWLGHLPNALNDPMFKQDTFGIPQHRTSPWTPVPPIPFLKKKKGNTPLVMRQAPCRRGSFRHFRTQKVWHFCWADTETNVFMPLQTRKGHFTQQHRKRQGKGLCHCESQNAPSLISQICHSCFGTIQYGIQLHLLQTHDLWFITSPWTCNGHRSFKLCDVGALQPTGLVETVANP